MHARVCACVSRGRRGVCVCTWVRACVREYVAVCVRVCVCVLGSMWLYACVCVLGSV